jgi:two-component system chemotaxis response regulator CheB
MPPIRVLVVDDSVVIRKVLTDSLAADPSVQIAGTASDGRLALARIAQLKPDLITLDVEMPNMSGLEAIKEIRKDHPHLPIIMFSTLTERGATTTLDALALGATDYVTKPSNTGSLDVTMEKIRRELLPKIKALCGRRLEQKALDPAQRPPVPPPSPSPSRSGPVAPVEVLAIGTSTGGPNALAAMLPGIPKDFPVPVVIVQHMPPLFTRLLAERLDKTTQIRIYEGEPGKKLEPGKAFIAPGDHHMVLERRAGGIHLALNQDPPENSCRPAVDVLFRSVAATYGANTLAVVMTGMGADGAIGAQAIRERGGRVFIQDEATSVVWGMPGAVHAAGCADSTFPLPAIAKEIDRHVHMSRQSLRQPVGVAPVR